MPNVGMRINETIVRPDQGLIDAFRGLPVANIGDSINRTFCMHPTIRPYNDNPLAGPAFTVKVRPGDNLLLHKALDLAAPGDIIVGDADGVVVISPKDANSVLEKASAKSRDEQQTLIDIENGSWGRGWVDATLAAKGCDLGR